MTKKLLLSFFLLVIVIIPIFAKTLPLDARLRGGKIHFQGGRYERALEQFENALIDYPTSSEARFWKAIALEKLGRYEEAAANFDTVFTQDSEWLSKTIKDNTYRYSAWNAFIKAGQALDQKGDFLNSIRFLKRSIEVFPSSPQGFLLLSQIYSALDSLEKIKEIALSLYDIDSTNQQVNILLGMYFFRKEDWDSSMFYYDKAISAFKNDWELTTQRLGKELKLNNVEEVELVVQKLLEKRNTKSLEVYINDSLKAKAKYPILIRLVDQLHMDQVELNIINFRAGISALQKANFYKQESLQKKYISKASNYFQEAILYNEFDFDSKYNLGLTFYRLGFDLKAESVFINLLDIALVPLNKFSPSFTEQLISLINNNNLNNAFLAINPEIINLIEQEVKEKRIYKGTDWYLYFHNFKKSKTVPTLQEADKVYLSSIGIESIENLYLLLGATQTNLKKYDEAIQMFNNVLLLNPKNQDAYRNLAVCYREKGDQKKAYEILQEGERVKKQL
ncbi:MAG: tetratricopeptide repeat protein [candidate division WOR-3 bacterium]